MYSNAYYLCVQTRDAFMTYADTNKSSGGRVERGDEFFGMLARTGVFPVSYHTCCLAHYIPCSYFNKHKPQLLSSMERHSAEHLKAEYRQNNVVCKMEWPFCFLRILGRRFLFMYA